MTSSGSRPKGGRLAGVALLVLLVPALVACSSSSKGSSAGASKGTATNPVVEDFTFSPNPIRIKAGQTVTWTNRDSTDHTIQADDSSFGSGHLGQAQTFSHQFTKSGTYTYHCAIHNYMKGTVIVG
jgi:plastocyanin